jgi:predicted nucleic acid-binding protein
MPKKRSSAPRAVVDSSVWVALLEDEEDRAEHVQRMLERAEAGEEQLLVSTITIGEVLKGPKANDPAMSEDRQRTFEDFLEAEYITLVSVDPAVARKARDIRREHPKLRTPDAIQIATAIVAGAGRLYTYDEDDLLPLDRYEGLEIIVPPVEHQTTLQLTYDEGRRDDQTDDLDEGPGGTGRTDGDDKGGGS